MLSVAQTRLLTLTMRKGDVETELALKSMEKLSLSREQTDLLQEYNTKLRAKNISYYANGKYNKVNYNYLMGYGANYTAILNPDKYALKCENSMVLSDYNGRMVLSDSYASAITKVLGAGAMDKDGRGGTFSKSEIPKILEALCPGFKAETFEAVINEEGLNSSYTGDNVNLLSGEKTGEKTTVDNSSSLEKQVKSIVDFYYPIFSGAAANGWTTEYNKEMALNEDYVCDAIATGSFQLATVNQDGNYDEGTSLSYYTLSGILAEKTDAGDREEIQAWYEAEKQRVSEKEDVLDITMDQLSTELEAINTEIQSVESLIQDGVQIFDWGSG